MYLKSYASVSDRGYRHFRGLIVVNMNFQSLREYHFLELSQVEKTLTLTNARY